MARLDVFRLTEVEVLLSDDGLVTLHARPGILDDSDIDFTYCFSTVMHDERCRLTWSNRNPKIKTRGLVVSAGSKGSFQKDLESHRAWIKEVSEQYGSNPVRVVSMDDRIAALKYCVLHLEPVSTSLIVLGEAAATVLVAFVFIGIIWVMRLALV